MLTARPITNWVQNLLIALRPQTAQTRAATIATSAKEQKAESLMIHICQECQPIPVTVVEVHGVLDRKGYEAFITRATELHQAGADQLLIDLRFVTGLELSGLFALYSVARLYAGGELLDPAVGWEALRSAAEEHLPALGRRFKLVGAAPQVERVLQKASFCRALPHYQELALALEAFKAVD
jgi:hypothetical protein